MESDDETAQENLAEGYAFEELFRDHHVACFSASLASIILGLPLAWNVLWHLKVRISRCEV